MSRTARNKIIKQRIEENKINRKKIFNDIKADIFQQGRKSEEQDRSVSSINFSGDYSISKEAGDISRIFEDSFDDDV